MVENKKFTAGVGGTIKAAIIRAVVITFVAALIFVGAFGSGDGVLAVFWLALIGSFIWEFANIVTVEVRSDGVSVSKSGNKATFYTYEKWYFSERGKNTLHAEMRKLDKTEDIVLKNFPSGTFRELSTLIKKRQEAYFLNKSAANRGVGDKPTTGTQTTISDMAKTESRASGYDFAKRAEAARASSAEASARNPYAKKPTSVPAVTSAKDAKITPVPASVKVKPAAAESSVTSGIPETPKVGETPKITGIPGISDLPDTSDFEKFLSEKPKASEHDHGEDFHKAVFYYPRRDIEDRVERVTTIKILTAITLAVAVFLAAYIFAPGFAVYEALFIGVVCLFSIGIAVGKKRAKLSGMPSKLEVTKNHLVLDNTRYRVGEMSSKFMTSPGTKAGNRVLRFSYAGKTIVCPLGPCAKPKKDQDEYFGRYSELCGALSEKGFECL